MFLKTLTLVVNLTFLLLAITIMTLLLKNDKYRADMMDFKSTLESFQMQNKKIDDTNLLYLESRINRVSEDLDSRSSTLDSRINILELRMKEFQADKRNQTKVVQNNLQIQNNN